MLEDMAVIIITKGYVRLDLIAGLGIRFMEVINMTDVEIHVRQFIDGNKIYFFRFGASRRELIGICGAGWGIEPDIPPYYEIKRIVSKQLKCTSKWWINRHGKDLFRQGDVDG